MNTLQSEVWPPHTATFAHAIQLLARCANPPRVMEIHSQDWKFMTSGVRWFFGTMFDLDTRDPYFLGVPVTHPEDAIPGTIKVRGTYGESFVVINRVQE